MLIRSGPQGALFAATAPPAVSVVQAVLWLILFPAF